MSVLSAGERAAITARARVFRGRLFAAKEYVHLLGLPSVGEIALFLAHSPGYAPYFDVPNADLMHRGEMEGILTAIPVLEETPFTRFVGAERTALLLAWGERFDAEIVKRVVRIITTGVGSRAALRRRIASVPITLADGEKLLAAQSLGDVLEAIRGYPLEPVLTAPLRRALGDVSQRVRAGALFRAKTAMDTFFLTRILSEGGRLRGSERRWVRRLFGVRADLINIYWIYRGRRFFNLSPEEALGMTLPVRYELDFATLSEFAFAPDVRSMLELMSASRRYGEAFRTSGVEERLSARGSLEDPVVQSEMTLEHNLYRVLWKTATDIFSSGSSGVHAPLAYLTLRELEVKDLFTIIENVRYGFDARQALSFLIHPEARSFSSVKERGSPWP